MDGGERTIDELAAEVGMTVRNIRAHQSRGLLPAPRIEGRTGYYRADHVRRLTQIQQMQDEGLNLAAISRVLHDGRLTDIAISPFAGTEPEYRRPGELLERLGIEAGDPAVARAADLGLIAYEDDRIRVDVPRLVVVAEQLAAQGVPLDAQLDAVDALRTASAGVAEAFMALADQHLVARVAAETGGDPEALRAAVEQLRVQAAEALVVLFDQAMAARIRAYFEPPPT
jgi:DNA-binding transcriptional MerR regulator